MNYKALDKRQFEIAQQVDYARRENKEPSYQAAIRAVAHNLATALCQGSQYRVFLMACGVAD